MKKKYLYLSLVFFLAFIVQSCNNSDIEVDFQYSPLEPRIGEAISFTNLSTGGDDFDWDFGNNSISLLKNPTKTYLVPGEYAITLKVDSNKKLIRTKHITVYDSIPYITYDGGDIRYFEKVTFRALVYNPYSRTKTYKWYFSQNAVGDSLSLEGDYMVSEAVNPVVYYTKKNIEESVLLQVTVGDSVYTADRIKTRTFTVKDVPAMSLVMARKDKKLLRQRIFEYGTEPAEEIDVLSGANPFNLVTYGNELYLFDAGSNIAENSNWESDNTGNGSIRVVNLDTYETRTVINNQGVSSYFGFYNGFVDNQYVYWTDRNDYVYRLEKSTRDKVFEWKGSAQQPTLPYYLIDANSLGITPGWYNGGLSIYSNVYFWGKGGSGRGIYRFDASNIAQPGVSSFQPILTDYAIRTFAIDGINGQIYFSSTAPADKVGLWVANLDGTNARLVDDVEMDDPLQYITGIVVDNNAGFVFWAYRAPGDGDASGVKRMRLVPKYGSPDRDGIQYFSKEKGVYGIALNRVKK